jgi:hypothetical protein
MFNFEFWIKKQKSEINKNDTKLNISSINLNLYLIFESKLLEKSKMIFKNIMLKSLIFSFNLRSKEHNLKTKI